MRVLKDIMAAVAGIGPNHETEHQNLRNLLRLDSDEYVTLFCNADEFYHTLPPLNKNSTIENTYNAAGKYRDSTADSAVAGLLLPILLFPDGKTARKKHEGSKPYRAVEINDQSHIAGLRTNDGPQILYNYYDVDLGPCLDVLIVDEMGKDQKYGTKMSNVKFAFKAKLKDFNANTVEYQNIELTHLYINGQYQPMSAKATEAAMLYAEKLTAMMFEDDGQQYDPKKAMKEVLDIHGEDVFKVSTWSARRNSTYKAATPS